MDAMTASPDSLSTATPTRAPLRIRLGHSAISGHLDGVWWPQSRDLQAEGADLVDHFPRPAGHIDRLLFSRPDWDNPVSGGRGVRHIQAQRGRVKVGSFPRDDTHTMVLVLSTGKRLHLQVIPSAADAAEAARELQQFVPSDPAHSRDPGWARWDEALPTA